MTKQAVRHLKRVDRIFAKIIPKIVLKERKAHKRYFESLAVAIINQQLSTKASATIEKRFITIFGSNKFPKPEEVLKKRDATLRKAGLSFQKISYIKSLAKLIYGNEINFSKFRNLSDEEIILNLTQVRGVGRWTAVMFLMFCLNRPDVFSHGDLGLKNAVKKWYRLEQHIHPKKYQTLVESWEPYRTTAAHYLWASLNLK